MGDVIFESRSDFGFTHLYGPAPLPSLAGSIILCWATNPVPGESDDPHSASETAAIRAVDASDGCCHCAARKTMILPKAMLAPADPVAAMALQRAVMSSNPGNTVHSMFARLLLIDDDTRLSAMVGDYLPKPFEPRELLARIKALLRRSAPHPAPDDVLRFGRLEVDLGARVARLSGQLCDLTGHQFDLLVVLAQRPGRVLSRDQIMDSLKGHPLEAFDRSIDVHISRIRAVIEDDPKLPRRVLTVRGAGYVFARKQDADDS